MKEICSPTGEWVGVNSLFSFMFLTRVKLLLKTAISKLSSRDVEQGKR